MTPMKTIATKRSKITKIRTVRKRVKKTMKEGAESSVDEEILTMTRRMETTMRSMIMDSLSSG